MNQQNLNLIQSMTDREYQTFLRSAVGLAQFKKLNDDTVIQSRRKQGDTVEKDPKKHFFAFLYTSESNRYDLAYYFLSDDRTAFYDTDNQKHPLTESFDRLFENEILYLILGSQQKKDFSLLLNAQDGITTVFGSPNAIKEKLHTECCRFILGSGIDGFIESLDWEKLLARMEEEIISNKLTDAKKLKDFEKKIGNTNYVSPQILKDLDESLYYDIIHNALYSSYTGMKDFLNLNKKKIDNETIFQIASIISAQAKTEKQTVLSFNYDNFLEDLLEERFLLRAEPLFNGKKANADVEIIHSHGFLPYPDATEEQKKSIVLSSFEYMDTYASQNEYGYRMLYRHLEKTNLIVGNSVSDYEEQKVFRNRHKNHLSEFHFLLTKESEEKWMDEYRSTFFLNIGIIPVFFPSFTELSDFLKSLIPSGETLPTA